MAFGITKEELNAWKEKASNEEIAFITHYWYDDRFPDCSTVTKAGCKNISKLKAWGREYGLKPEWIHYRNPFPHFDLLGERQRHILKAEKQFQQIERFALDDRTRLKESETRKR
ncbi:hypothetical protein SAMN05192534_101331 [Alteribacillus persepolensis]|uniref:Uncharacterized protein n=1 Tax=Alteribacillus persepolensis TaxID=568899 RepID=A0A1G7YZ06_9BACI|nr:hypothetical protein [Alteribacillus persepolensis]SDH01693.1 hypothetical protein SAMN05192534_101331 [Alteribacillus persepolensis]